MRAKEQSISRRHLRGDIPATTSETKFRERLGRLGAGMMRILGYGNEHRPVFLCRLRPDRAAPALRRLQHPAGQPALAVGDATPSEMDSDFLAAGACRQRCVAFSFHVRVGRHSGNSAGLRLHRLQHMARQIGLAAGDAAPCKMERHFPARGAGRQRRDIYGNNGYSRQQVM